MIPPAASFFRAPAPLTSRARLTASPERQYARAQMEGGGRAPRGTRFPQLATAVAAAALVLVAATLAAKPKGDDVHRSEAQCATCHTADAAALRQDPKAAASDLAPDLETRCAKCHDEGPSHRTGIKPVRPVPAALPLAADGTIGCGTCHFMHAEKN